MAACFNATSFSGVFSAISDFYWHKRLPNITQMFQCFLNTFMLKVQHCISEILNTTLSERCHSIHRIFFSMELYNVTKYWYSRSIYTSENIQNLQSRTRHIRLSSNTLVILNYYVECLSDQSSSSYHHLIRRNRIKIVYSFCWWVFCLLFAAVVVVIFPNGRLTLFFAEQWLISAIFTILFSIASQCPWNTSTICTGELVFWTTHP